MSKLPIDKEYLRNQFSAYNTNVINPQLQILIDGIKGKISLQQNASNKGKLFIIGEDGIVGVQAPLTSYNGESPAPISGLAVKDAISTLATAKVGGEGKYIQSIVENQGIITAIEANADFATSVQGNRADSAVQTIKVKSRIDEPAKTYQGNDIVLPDYPTSLPASDVYAWAKASTRPDYSFNDLTSHPNNLAGYGILDAATSAQGSKADSAVQQVTVNGNTYQGNKIILPDYPDSLAPGDIADWAKQPNPPQYPTLAAAGIQDAATATQGAKADSAVQTITFDNNTYSGPNITLTRPSYSFNEITDKPTTLQGYGIIDAATAAQGSKADSAIQGAIQDGSEITINSKKQLVLPSFPKSLPASDVYSWAKAANKPTYNFSEILNKPLGEPTIVAADGTIISTGIATLDSHGKVPSSQLPSFVDDVVEGYLSGGKFYKESAHTTAISGESGKIYIDLSTEKTYRWSGSTFVVISETLALGETYSTAYRGDRGKTAYDHSQSTHARTDATKVEASSTNGNIKINGTETTVYTHPSGTNPHGTTKSDVGLGNVGNFKAVSTVASQGLSDTEKANARANIGAGTSSFSGSYNDLSNKPTIPTVGNGTITIKQAGTSKGTFTMNQSGNTTIELTDNNTTYGVATSSALGLVKSGTDITVDSSGNVSVNDDSHNHTQIKYCANISSDDAINNFLEAETFKTAVWTSTSSPGVSNGIILSGGYVNDTYGYQLAIDDDPTYYMALRQKSNNGWSSWKQIPMGDGTGASGTWNINISGNATTATSAGNADTLDGKNASDFANASHTHNYAGSSSAGGSANTALGLSPFTISNIDELDSFLSGNAVMKYAKASNCNIGFVANDGLVISLPWSSAFGAQIAIDDQSNWMGIRTKNNGTWNSWSKIALESEIESKLYSYLPLSGGTVTGATTFNNAVTVKTLVLGTTPSTTVGALWYE